MIFTEPRDPRFVTVRRGGTLSDANHRLLALWAAACAEHVLHFVEDALPGDDRSRRAIELNHAWVRGEITVRQALKAAASRAAAREVSGAARYAAYAAAQAAAGLAAPVAAQAQNARCFTTDDGYYDCTFTGRGGDGSFEISAPGYPTFRLEMDGPGVAFAAGRFEAGGRFVPLPGAFRRSAEDRACWVSDATGVAICAW